MVEYICRMNCTLHLNISNDYVKNISVSIFQSYDMGHFNHSFLNYF